MLIAFAMVISLLPAFLITARAASTTAPTANGAKGTALKPYIIDEYDDLVWIADQVNTGATKYSGMYFLQTADIDMSGKSWTPIGGQVISSSLCTFCGNYNGNGYTISNLTCTSSLAYVGLFGYINGGSINNLKLYNVQITNTDVSITSKCIGALAGTCIASVTNCHVTGTISLVSDVECSTVMGGLIGSGSGTVTRCSVDATVTSSNSLAGLGGIIGKHSGNIENCMFKGTVTNSSAVAKNELGGIAGWITGGNIRHCYSTGTLTTVSPAKGGIAGHNYNYSTSYISESDNNYFLTGTAAYGYGKYTVVTVNPDSAPSNVGAISKTAGELKTNSTYTDNGWDFAVIWNNDTNGTTYPYLRALAKISIINIDTSNPDSAIVNANLASNGGDTISVMGVEYRLYGTSAFTQAVAASTAIGNFSVSLNGLPMGVYDVRAYATNNVGTTYGAVQQLTEHAPSGAGTEISPYIIDTAEKLNFVRYDPDAFYQLNCDLNLASTSYATWQPIGSYDIPFTGAFDGQGHKISGYTASYVTSAPDGADLKYSGLFAYIGTAGSVKRLGVSGALTSSAFYIGGIAAYNLGVISECFNSGTLSATIDGNVGGIAGCNGGTIINCYNTGNISAGNTVSNWPNAGGIAAIDADVTGVNVTNCYNTGAITCGINVYGAGIVGCASCSAVTGCFNTGTVTITGTVVGDALIGGVIVDYEAIFGKSPTLTYCDFVAQDELTIDSVSSSATGQATAGYFTDGSSGTYSAAFYTAMVTDWDFTDIWQYKSASYPELKVFTPLPAVALSVNNANIAENAGVATVTATLSAVTTKDVTVTLGHTGTATGSGTDYTASAATITIAAGSTTGTVTITAVNDTLDEADETVIIDITGVTNGTESAAQQVTTTITDDDDAPAISANDPSVTEGNADTVTLAFTVSLSTPSGKAVTVDYATANGTATAGTDYTAKSGTLTFAPGETSRTVSVTVEGDTVTEPDETVLLNLSNAINSSISDAQGSGTITNDDAVPAISVDNVSVAEGNAGTSTMTFTVSLDHASASAITVDYATADNTATAGTDYTAKNGTLAFAAGDTSKMVSVTISGDLGYETNESFYINLTNQSNASIFDARGIGTITNDDAAPTVTLSINNTSITENGTATVTATLSAVSSEDVTVTLGYTGTATGSGTDYTASAAAITIAAGSTTGTVTITAVNDTLDEADETVIIDITGVTNGTESGAQQVTTTITDNDDAPTISANDPSVTEGNTDTVTLAFTVSLSTPSGKAVTVDYATANGTATAGTDYTAKSGTLTFAPGETSKTVSVTVAGDTVTEPDETVLHKPYKPVECFNF